MRRAFTLIEVIVAVMLISVVITALLQLYANNSRYFDRFRTSGADALSATLLLGVDEQESERIRLGRLCEGFELDDELRQALKQRSMKKTDTLVMTLEEQGSKTVMSDHDRSDDRQYPALEVWRSVISIDGQPAVLVRLRLP
jgi:prepilin-type N-terminal cleavage/methylation domain-containing protein